MAKPSRLTSADRRQGLENPEDRGNAEFQLGRLGRGTWIAVTRRSSISRPSAPLARATYMVAWCGAPAEASFRRGMAAPLEFCY